jgi:cell division septation protein DedD
MNPMGWWRRNWVDTLMITLILLVVGGFVSLLLRGTPNLNATNNTPVNQNVTTSSPSAVSSKAPVPTSKPSSSKPSDNSSPTESGKTTPTEMTRVEPSSVTASTSSKPATSTSSTDESAMGSESQAVSANSLNAQSKADSPQLDSSEPAQATGSREPAQATGNATVTLSKAAAKPAPPRVSTIVETPVAPKPVIRAPAPRPAVIASKPVAKPQVISKTVPSSPSRSVYLRSYRVAVGSFSAPSRAESLASSLRNEGLPARAIRSGANTVVIVGPYKTESEAQAAFDQVRTSHNDAILFKPNGAKVRANAGSQAAAPSETTPTETVPEATSSIPAQSSDEVSASSAQTPQATPETAQVSLTQAKPAPLGRYLQVGAFKDIASAGPVLAKLAKYGYRGTLDQGSDGLTRVLVGPYDSKTFERAKRNLRTRGFKVFAAK